VRKYVRHRRVSVALGPRTFADELAMLMANSIDAFYPDASNKSKHAVIFYSPTQAMQAALHIVTLPQALKQHK